MNLRRRGTSWQLDYYDENGKRQRITVKAHTKERAQRMLDELRLDVSRRRSGLAPEAPNPQALTVGDLVKAWLKGPAKRLANHDKATAQTRMVSADLAAKRADLVTRADVEAWLHALEAGGYAPKSVNHARATLRTIYSSAIRAGLVRCGNPAEGTTPRKVPQRQLTTLSAAEVVRLLDHVRDPTRAIYAVAIYAGLRRGEIWALRRDCIDLDLGIITVQASNDRDQTKSGKVRVIPVHPELRPHLARVLLSHRDELVFPSPAGGLRSAEAKTSRDLRATLEGLGIRPMRFHDLRHTAATLLLQAGVGIAHLQRILGHSTPVLTANTYGHLVVDDLRRAMAQLSISGDRGVTGAESQASAKSSKTGRGDL